MHEDEKKTIPQDANKIKLDASQFPQNHIDTDLDKRLPSQEPQNKKLDTNSVSYTYTYDDALGPIPIENV